MSAVTDADSISDATWFDAHAYREFRARRGDGGRVWLIRRYRSAFLRTAIAAELSPDDSDAAIRPVWFANVYPDLLTGQTRRRAGGRR